MSKSIKEIAGDCYEPLIGHSFNRDSFIELISPVLSKDISQTIEEKEELLKGFDYVVECASDDKKWKALQCFIKNMRVVLKTHRDQKDA